MTFDWKKDYARERNRQYRLENPDKISAQNKRGKMKMRYGMAVDDWEKLFTSQGNQCAVCKTNDEKKWCTDHNHITGAVRGILCHKCNTAIGLMNDNPEMLRAAALYVEK